MKAISMTLALVAFALVVPAALASTTNAHVDLLASNADAMTAPVLHSGPFVQYCSSGGVYNNGALTECSGRSVIV